MTTEYYIGSTTQTLSKRMGEHRKQYKKFLNKTFNYISSFEILKYDDAYIELYEAYPCENKEQLRKREGEIIREKKNEIVNIRIETRTNAEWYIDNKEVLCEKMKIYREQNKEKLSQQKKEYIESNYDEVKERWAEYRNSHKEEIKAWKKQVIKCECGASITKGSKALHIKSEKHKSKIST